MHAIRSLGWILMLTAVSGIAACNSRDRHVDTEPSNPTSQGAAREAGAWYRSDSREVRRVGTVKRDRLIMAYYASQLVGDDLAKLKTEHAAAIRANDHEKAAGLERKGAAMQKIAHNQLWGNEPITPIIDRLRDRLASVAQEADVDQIVEAGSPVPSGTASVDVTDRVVALLPMRSDLPKRAEQGR
jgi:hypothetical protein